MALAPIILDVFSLEALCNYIGSKKIDHWQEIEKVKLKNKIKILNPMVNWGRSPWQMVSEAISIRNDLAHGRPEVLEHEEIIEVKFADAEHRGDLEPRARWERALDADYLQKVHSSIENAASELLGVNGMNPYEFHNFGISSSGIGILKK